MAWISRNSCARKFVLFRVLAEWKPGHISFDTKVQDKCKDYTCTDAYQKTDWKLSHGCAKINENTNSGSSQGWESEILSIR
ncbi:hypothetical protein V6N12_062130 [Hibiscus sabdariffa]|uniref:Uncharacterized protein n=1 Tax=Hibiscus sabdariffa TaxID=183260 RepID=A0ABR2F7Y7_9ROSI